MSQLITGTNGAGKSNLAITTAVADAIKTERPIYYTQIELYPDVINQDNNSNIEFIELTPEEMYNWQDEVIEPSILLCDEAQKIWREIEMKRLIRKTGEFPECISSFETHRHQGHDFYFTCQMPQQLFDGIRDVINQYIHIVNHGQTFRKIYEWPEYRSPASQGNRNDAEMRITKPVKKTFSWYKSTELNTRKLQVPRTLKIALTVGVIAIAWGAFNYSKFKENMHMTTDETAPKQHEEQKNELFNIGGTQNNQPTAMDVKTIINSNVPDEVIFKPMRGVNHLTSAAYHSVAVLPEPVGFSGCLYSGDTCLCLDKKAQIIPTDYNECMQYIYDKKNNIFRFDGYTTSAIQQAPEVQNLTIMGGGGIEEAKADDKSDDMRSRVFTIPARDDLHIKPYLN